MRRFALLFLLTAAALVAPSVARAQDVTTGQPTPAPIVTASVAVPMGPTLDDATVGIHRTPGQTTTTPTNVAPAVRHGDQATALMIVGGAAVGLYGLYLYLQ